MIDKTLLVDCPTNDYACPYWDWRYHKCTMKAQKEGDPQEECDNFWNEEDVDWAHRMWNAECEEEDEVDTFRGEMYDK